MADTGHSIELAAGAPGAAAVEEVDVAIVGGGPAGVAAATRLRRPSALAAAIALLTVGPTRPRVVVVEKQADGRDASEGTSMGLEVNGLRALRGIDAVLHDRVVRASLGIEFLRVCDEGGSGERR
eukprot:gene7291-8032_t